MSTANHFLKDDNNKKNHSCDVCNGLLTDQYLVDEFGNKFHQRHSNEFHQCDNCSRLICKNITNSGVELSDGRKLCNICYSPALYPHEIDNMINAVVVFLKSRKLNLDMSTIQIKLVNRNELRRVMKGNAAVNTEGFCSTLTEETRKNNRIVSQINQHNIYILNHIPELKMASILCHELMHAWVHDNTNIKHIRPLLEGSCNYLSYVFLKEINSPLANELIRHLINNNDPIYGVGFNRVRNKFQNQELSNLLIYLKKYRGF